MKDFSKYKGYFETYLNLVKHSDLIPLMHAQLDEWTTEMKSFSPNFWNYRYDSHKWSIRELVGHLNDTERIMAYRAMAFARGEQTEIPGYDENAYVEAAHFDKKDPDTLMQEFIALRQSTICLFKLLSQEELAVEGKFSRTSLSVEGLGYLICGHIEHHRVVIRERYH